MTKKHFENAAVNVNAIRKGYWTSEAPRWANAELMARIPDDYTRAVQTAEAYIMLFKQFNPRFDQDKFLVACGLAEAPAKRRR